LSSQLLEQQKNLRLQRWIAIGSAVLLIVKFTAYYITHSVAILTDALESIVNVVAGFIGLYSLYVSAKPKDIDHPYGHGKAEFVSAAVEGTLIFSAGAIIIYNAVRNIFLPQTLEKIDLGIYLVGATAIINWILGFFHCNKEGKIILLRLLQAAGIYKPIPIPLLVSLRGLF
jgi:cation diffusion facilitator family transporter